MRNFFTYWKKDLPAGLVVFFVALPLSLGVSMASTGDHQNLFAGIISGVIGGVVVGLLSGSRLGVSGAAAGLITIVMAAINTLGSFEAFLLALFLAGAIQLLAGLLKAGVIGHYIPSSVIKGMLASIGITLIINELPHALGYDKTHMIDHSAHSAHGLFLFDTLAMALYRVHPGAVIISLFAVLVLILSERPSLKKSWVFSTLPGAFFAVIGGMLINIGFAAFVPEWALTGENTVTLPRAQSWDDFVSFFTFPDFSQLNNSKVYVIALTLALVGSLETLLSLEATDKLDPEKQRTPTNRELMAQGAGNMLSGLIGGLPVTQVIVRSSANISSGGKTKLSTIFHGLLLAFSAILIPGLLNKIPLAALAAILMMVGYKLAKISLFKHMYKLGPEQYMPFIVTIIGVFLTDMLKGIGFGVLLALFYIIRKNYRNNYRKSDELQGSVLHTTLTLSEEVTFLNKAGILEALHKVPKGALLTIDGSHCHTIDYDVLELIQEFIQHTAPERNIQVNTLYIPEVSTGPGH